MAENQYIQEPKAKKIKKEKPSVKSFSFSIPDFLKDERFRISLGAFLVVLAVSLFFAFISHFVSGKADQSVIYDSTQTLAEQGDQVENKIGYSGSFLSHYFVNQWFGIGSFLVIPVVLLIGLALFRGRMFQNQVRFSKAAFFAGIWVSVFLGFIASNTSDSSEVIFYCGQTGYVIAHFLNGFLGWGTFLLLALVLMVFFIYFFDLGYVVGIGKQQNPLAHDEQDDLANHLVPDESLLDLDPEDEQIEPLEVEPLQRQSGSTTGLELEIEESNPEPDEIVAPKPPQTINTQLGVDPNQEGFSVVNSSESDQQRREEEQDLDFVVSDAVEEKESTAMTALNMDSYDPTLDLSHYKYPTIDLMPAAPVNKIQVTREELEANKNKIVDTLANYKIGISHIKATIGPTVTLYEIIPEAGVKISKIKNLEDDIALSLAALGIRIIAPIPGKGTIGIEVPNTNRELVSFRSLLMTEKFITSKMALPVVMGKTITNEVFMFDLAKMPHILMAGATGQGKSVGLNIILASLLYKKHPAQLKFVLVDPKKVELSIFSKIERHFLAKLPDEEEAIITDTSKVINTLNSLCIEMDNRYDLLKDAGCRNLKEYNTKFIDRKLNPEKGHKFMPYIVLVIDELADLMMTAGKEVETPIARLAQLARAIGIHLVVATQRPSVNVITGIIKANFPARISFKVTSKIDSRTILDSGGADQLIGMGDMLFSQGSEITRVQCGFVDTPEVDAIVDFIGEQRGYSTAFLLPEYAGEAGDDQSSGVDLKDRDVMFEEAARVIVINQQGSTSLIQRKLKLGYNRAGRIVDQLEAAGVVGPFQGAKARDVLIPDEYALEQLLLQMENRN